MEGLLDVVGLRVAARGLGIERVEAGGGRAVLTFAPSTPVTPDRMLKMIAASRGALKLRKEYTVEARIPPSPGLRCATPSRSSWIPSDEAARSRGGCRCWLSLHGRGLLDPVLGAAARQEQAGAAGGGAGRAPSTSAPILTSRDQLHASEDVVDRVICVVNNDAITQYELDEAELYYLAETRERPSDGGRAQAASRPAPADLIENRIQLQQAEREKVGAEDSELRSRSTTS